MTTILPYALFLACPLMMLWMMTGLNHGGMNHGTGSGNPGDQDHLRGTEYPPSSSGRDR